MQQEEFDRVLEAVLESISADYSKTTMDLWFSKLKLLSISSRKVVLQAESKWKCDVLKNRHYTVLKNCFSEVLGFEAEVELISIDDGPPPEPAPEPEKESAYHQRYQVSYTFDNFVVGKSNALAQKASLAVAQHPAELNNPLFLYGPSGLGKTHLLFAVMNLAREIYPSYTILYVTCEEFTNEMVAAMAEKKAADFRAKYRTVDILLIDDIQFLAGKFGIQQEFFHTFDALYTGRKQIIIASDRPPRDIDNLEARLVSRFESGLVADIQPPDLELRIAIFKRKAMDINFDLPNDVLTYLAENVRLNIRQIEGSLIKLRAKSFIEGKTVTLELAEKVLTEFLRDSATENNIIDRVFKYVTTRYGVTKEQLKGAQRSAEIVFPRHLAVYLIRHLTNLSLKSIAQVFGRKDHTSIMNSISVIETKMKSDAAFERNVRQMIDEIMAE